RDLLVRILTDSEFAAEGVHTGLLADRLAEWSRPLLDQDQRARAAVAAALAQATAAQAAARVQSRIPSGWRALASQPRRVRFGAGADADETDVAVAYSTDRDRFVVHDPAGIAVRDVGPDRVTLTHEGVRETYSVASYPDGVVDVDGPHGSVTLTRRPRFADPTDQGITPGSLLAPMPGVVTRIHVGPGEQVAAGAPVMTLEAMKMQYEIRAPIDGVVAGISMREGAQVDSGTILAVVDPAQSAERDENTGESDAELQIRPTQRSPEEEPT
ncbi:MAG TPA: biotin/lipoyl-containing protein, partial [Nocardioidaceae bacterium]|nr:biotin/lipoyl-containing protein [Nocardioidaceae bacterium]